MTTRSHAKTRLLTLSLLLASACSEALYPPRPAQIPGPPVADPPQSQAVLHLVLTQEGLSQLLEGAVPRSGEGLFTFIGTRRYGWTRGAFSVRFDSATGRISVSAPVVGQADLPAKQVEFPMTLTVEAQPVLSADYKAQLQAASVTLTTDDRLLRAAEWGGGVLGTIRGAIEKALRDLRVDLKPPLAAAYGRLARPLAFQVGAATACADLGIRAVEAGPTVLAGGVEKDLAVVLAPSVTLPCNVPIGAMATLPPLHNVASLPSGPFSVVVPVAATYDELQKAMTQAFSGGKLFFSKENPDLYLEQPEVYASGGQLVVKVHLAGFVKKGFKITLSGDLYLTGHPEVRDNFLEVPDIQHTVETRDALLKLKTSLDGESIRREVRQALRLDISARLAGVKQRLSNDLTFSSPSRDGKGLTGCVRADVGRIAVTGLFAHDAYLRLYVQATAQAAAYFPCLK